MLIPVGEDTSVPVTMVLLPPDLSGEAGPPMFLSGTLIRLEPDDLRVTVSAATATPNVGTRIIVNAGERTKLTGRLMAVAGTVWTVSRDHMHATDDRAAPRVRSRLQLRWCHADEANAAAWLAGDHDVHDWSMFAGGGDLSLSGVRVDLKPDPSNLVPSAGDRLFLEIGIGGVTHRLLGIVRRVETSGHSSVAIEFLEVPERTFDALSDYTLQNL